MPIDFVLDFLGFDTDNNTNIFQKEKKRQTMTRKKINPDNLSVEEIANNYVAACEAKIEKNRHVTLNLNKKEEEGKKCQDMVIIT